MINRRSVSDASAGFKLCKEHDCIPGLWRTSRDIFGNRPGPFVRLRVYVALKRGKRRECRRETSYYVLICKMDVGTENLWNLWNLRIPQALGHALRTVYVHARTCVCMYTYVHGDMAARERARSPSSRIYSLRRSVSLAHATSVASIEIGLAFVYYGTQSRENVAGSKCVFGA